MVLDKVADPVKIGSLGADRVVARANSVANAILQFGHGWANWRKVVSIREKTDSEAWAEDDQNVGHLRREVPEKAVGGSMSYEQIRSCSAEINDTPSRFNATSCRGFGC